MQNVAEPSPSINPLRSADDAIVAVGSKFAKGLAWDEKETWDWNEPRGSAQNSLRLKPFAIRNLREMFERKWSNRDTAINHLLQYIVVDQDGQPLKTQPRLKDTGVDLLRSKGFEVWRTMLYTEIDLPDHKPWSETNPEVAMGLIELLRDAAQPGGPLHGCIIQFTRRGVHIIMLLATPLEIFESEAYEREWHKQIAAFGIILAADAKGWKHVYRFPSAPYDAVYRDKKGQKLPYEERMKELQKADAKFEDSQRTAKFLFSFDDAIPRDPQTVFPTNAAEHAEIKRKRSASRQKTRRGNVYVVAAAISNRWEPYAADLGKVIGAGPQNLLHYAYLYLAAFLCQLGMVPEVVPGFIGMVANDAGSSNPQGNVEGAEGTVRKWLNREMCAGEKHLRAEFPHIWEETLRIFTLIKTHAKLFDVDLDSKVELVTYEQAQTAVAEIIAGDGQTGTDLVIVSPGAGKTFSAVESAAETSDRANVGFAADTNVLCKQIAKGFGRKGKTTLRVFGSSSVEGEHACKFRESALAIAESGQSTFAVLCMGSGKQQCEHFNTCKAKDRAEGDRSSNVMIGPHAKLAELLEHVGIKGKLLIDEAKAQILADMLTLDELLHTREFSEHFSKSYVRRMTPLLDAFIAWVSSIAPNRFESIAFNDLPAACEDAVDVEQLQGECFNATIEIHDIPEAVKALALSAIEEGKPPNPPIRLRDIHRIRTQPSFARDVAKASRVFAALYNAVSRKDRTAVHVGQNDGGRYAKLLYIDPIYKQAVNRPDGRTILLDATGETQKFVLKQLCPDARTTELHLEDRCEVHREMHYTKTKKRWWFSEGQKPHWEGPIKFSFEHIRDRITREQSAGHGKRVCIITHKAVRAVLQAALGLKSPEMQDPRAAWRAMGHSDAELNRGIAFVRKYLPDADYTLFHYGAERGRNEAMDCDMIVTLGDPRPNLDEIRYEADLVGADPQERMHAATAATLTQAHGRARHVSPFRAGGYVFALHIGSVAPSEPQWHMQDRVKTTFAPPAEAAKVAMTNQEFAILFAASGKTVGAVADALHVARRTVSRWLSADGPGITAADEAAIRAALAPEDPDIPSEPAVA